jgi:hypothetical protein
MSEMAFCADCNGRVTWSGQRRQFGRAVQDYGLTPEEAKQIMPRCGKCLTELMRERGRKATTRRIRPLPGARAF